MITLLTRLALALLLALPVSAQAAFYPGPATPLSFRNKVRNGNFAINQRVVSGTVTLAAGAYGHDGVKGGSNGATYTFSTAANGDTTLSISAGTILLPIEGALYLPEGGTYTLSWSGSGTCRFYQGTAAGTYVVAPLVVTGVTSGTNGAVECSTGTLGLVQFEPGPIATPFERRDDELRRNQRYFQKSYDPGTAPGAAPGNGGATVNLNAPGSGAVGDFVLPVVMRATPTLTMYDGVGAAGKVSYYDGAWKGGGALTATAARPQRLFIQTNISGSVQVNFDFTLSAEL